MSVSTHTVFIYACMYVCMYVCAYIYLGRRLDVNNVVEVLTDGEFSAADSENLGLSLGVKLCVMKTSRSNRSGRVEHQLMDIIDHWILNDPEASWEKLSNALEKCCYRNLAKNLCLKVKKASVKKVSLHTDHGSSNITSIPSKEEGN